MLCGNCGKNLRVGSVFCGKCGTQIPIKCRKCGTVREEDDDVFCIKCGKKLPESPFADEDTDSSPSKPDPKTESNSAPEPAKAEEPKAEHEEESQPAEKPESETKSEGEWKLSSGKDLLEFYDTFSYKVGFVIDEEEPVEGTSFVLKANRSILVLWDEKRNGIKLEGFYKEGKRVSFWANIQKNGSNDQQNSVGGVDKVVLEQLDSVYSYIEYYNPKLITAIDKTYEKYCR
ncbi:MAG: zinc ribbon domain-containing protein [Defluviitaleaceae bacterium]|nr:zinc ribbon domain-containing protein [Defluviitaleaceae bacterium]